VPRQTDRLEQTPPDEGRAGRRSRARTIGPWAIGGLALILALVGLMISMNAGRAPAAPPAPAILRPATALGARGACDGFLEAKAMLAWTPSSSRIADGYVIYRSLARNGPYETIGIIPGRSVDRFVDAKLSLNTTYFYRLRATSGNRMSGFTGSARAETPFICL
jgi:hypothetical protein